jgi:hypothetical protein
MAALDALLAAMVAWSRRHASESPAAAVVYACALSNEAHEFIQSIMFRYWKNGLPSASVGFPFKGTSRDPQALISSVQKLVQTSPRLQDVEDEAVIRSPAGPA